MKVSLTADLERWVQSRIDQGLYSTASEVVHEALRLLIEHERLQAARVDELRREIQIGIDSLDRGEGILVDEKFFEELEREGRARLRHG